MAINKPRFRQGGRGHGEIDAPEENVHALCVTHGSFVHARHPGGDGVAARHSIGHGRFVQRGGCPPQSVTHLLHGSNHPFPGNIAILGRKHCMSFLHLIALGNKLGYV